MSDEQHDFPNTLYINEPGDNLPYEGYTEWEDNEEGAVVAVYALQRVFRVKVEKTQGMLK